MIKVYNTSQDFRRSLESRLLAISQETDEDLQRLRRKLAFDRLLVRLFNKKGLNLVLKGGYSLELRFFNARSTKDIDFNLSILSPVQADALLTELKEACEKDFGDFFSFSIGFPKQELNNAQEGGYRFPVEAHMDSRIFVKFHLDIGFGDFECVEEIQGENWLGFAGIQPPLIRMITKEQQFAEKLHAYTLPRGDRINSRVKDLIDMFLLISDSTLNTGKVFQNIKSVFNKRNTHLTPNLLLPPPLSWESRYKELARECTINHSLNEAFEVLSLFYNNLITKRDL